MRVQSEQPNVEQQITGLFELYADDVFRYAAWMLKSREEAEDVTQEVFVKVLQGWNTFRGESTAKTWIWSIAKNTVTDEIRKKSRLRHWLQHMHQGYKDVVSSDAFEFAEMKIDLWSLPMAQRQVVLLRLVHDLTSKETAQVLGWSEAKVRTTLHRGVKKLRQSFISDEIESVGGNFSE